MTLMTKTSVFAKDTLKGLTSPDKYLMPRYFYDEKGSVIFQQIMQMPEYYLTDCEQEIFSEQSEEISRAATKGYGSFELAELGPGDGIKSRILIRELFARNKHFSYLPVDISIHALNELSHNLCSDIPDIDIQPRTGDFFRIMKELSPNGDGKNTIILFLGSNIGNFSQPERHDFMNLLSGMTKPGDRALIGFDLKKDPNIIVKAYDDPHGHTRDFNLNHLERINNELEGEFNTENFRHHASYNPFTGAMKSYLVSTRKQEIPIGALDVTIAFDSWEPIFMEQSVKFNDTDIRKLAASYGFRVEKNFTDRRNYFADSLWVKE